MVNRIVLWIQVLLLLFLFVGPADAAESWWRVGDSGDGLWSNASNWWEGVVPDGNDNAHIDYPVPAFCTVNPITGPVEITNCFVGDWQQDPGEDPWETLIATLDINDQNFIVKSHLVIGAKETEWFSQGDGDGAVGDVNVINGGTINVGGDLWVGADGVGYLNVRKGDVNIVGTLRCPDYYNGGGADYDGGSYNGREYTWGVGNIDVNGTIKADDIYSKPEDEAHINIRGGTLILNGDKVATIESLVSMGRLYAYGGGGDLKYDYNVTNAGKTTVTATFDPNRAAYPVPANYKRDVSTTTDISWSAGASAASHDVYFGTNFDDVNEANNAPGMWPEFKGNQPLGDTDYDPGVLESFTEYFWRIDEVNGATTWRGGVWRFTTENLYVAKNPDPAHNARYVTSYKTLSWTGGIAANSHNVYIGSSFDEVNEATTPTATMVGDSNTSYTPPGGLLLGEVEYYWRVDEVNTVTSTTWTGPVWKFTTASSRVVDNFEGYDPPPPPFTYFWNEGGNADVSLSTDSPVFVPDDTNAMQLEYSNNTDPWKSYTTCREIQPGAARRDWVIGGVEILGISFHGEQDNDVEQLYVTVEDADGNTATVLYSDSNHIMQWSNEEWRWWGIELKKFSDAGVNLLDVRYLTIGLGDGVSPGGSGTVYFDNIELQPPICLNQGGDADLNNDCAVDINDIELLADDWLKAGYDVNAGTASDANLILWYKFDHEGADNIAVDSSGNGHHGELKGDTDWESPGYPGSGGSCVFFREPDPVGYYLSYIVVPAAAAPNDLGGHSTVALWIKDEGIQTDTTKVPSDEIGTQLFQAGPSGQGNLQVSLQWNGYFSYVCGWNTENEWEDTVNWGEWGYYNPEHPLGQWVHYAFVKDATAGLMRIYQNGKIVAELSGATGLKMPDVEPDHPDNYQRSWFTIGAWRWYEGLGGYYWGWMDDFRLYNRALSQEEIMDLADVSSLHQPVVSSAEVTGDDIVNFEDYAVAAAEWLEDPLLWPY